MSCNGCRVLRKGCNDACILRQSLQGIDSPQAQGNATLFVAKFFGRAGLISFLSAVPQSQRPALFRSLLFEACGRTVNPVNGAVGLLWTRNWHVCQSAVETVLRGGSVCAMPELFTGPSENDIDLSEVFCNDGHRVDLFRSRQDLKICNKRKAEMRPEDLDLCLTSRRRSVTPASDESDTTTMESLARVPASQQHQQKETKILRLFL